MAKAFTLVLKSSLILSAGVMVGNFANYLFTLIMGRMLGPESYGILASLMALFGIISFASGTIQTVALKFSSIFYSQRVLSKIHFLFNFLTKRFLSLGLLAFLLLLALSPLLVKFLNFSSLVPLILMLLVVPISFLLPVNRGILQGLQKFKSLSLNSMVDPLTKLALSILLVWLGLKVNGALIAFVLGFLAAYFLSFLPLRGIFEQPKEKTVIKDIKKYFSTVLVALFFLFLMMNQDIILAKHLLQSSQAGLYAALSIMAKIVVFITLPVVGVMFPLIAELYEKKERHFQILLNSFILVLIISLLVLAVYSVAPGLSTKILFGSQYLEVAPLLPLFAFAILIYALANLLANYFLAIGQLSFIWPLAFLTILEFALIYFFHDSFLTIIRILTLIFSLALASFSLLYLYSKKETIKSFFQR